MNAIRLFPTLGAALTIGLLAGTALAADKVTTASGFSTPAQVCCTSRRWRTR